mmetsp:Transcript_1972/g.2063  ORF Transcript_1972/g.2063 Transcript_1972/m.2063 type:complete len:180 (+) Transcript_1972:760-1299(+)
MDKVLAQLETSKPQIVELENGITVANTKLLEAQEQHATLEMQLDDALSDLSEVQDIKTQVEQLQIKLKSLNQGDITIEGKNEILEDQKGVLDVAVKDISSRIASVKEEVVDINAGDTLLIPDIKQKVDNLVEELDNFKSQQEAGIHKLEDNDATHLTNFRGYSSNWIWQTPKYSLLETK